MGTASLEPILTQLITDDGASVLQQRTDLITLIETLVCVDLPVNN